MVTVKQSFKVNAIRFTLSKLFSSLTDFLQYILVYYHFIIAFDKCQDVNFSPGNLVVHLILMAIFWMIIFQGNALKSANGPGMDIKTVKILNKILVIITFK